MKNKKAMLKHEVGGIIIAVLCLLVLFGLALLLYYTFEKSDLDKAKSNLDEFVRDFEYFMGITETEKNFMFLGPKEWFLVSYKKGGYIPNECKDFEYCICFCYFDAKGTTNQEKCDMQGACLEVPNYIDIPSYELLTDYIYVSEALCVLTLQKDKEKVNVKSWECS